jgi:hypothetical protein
MSEEMRRVAVDGIRARNPTFDDAEVHLEWLRILHGSRMATLISAASTAS